MTATDVLATEAEQLVRSRLDELLATHDPATTPAVEFAGARFDAGLAWVWFPEGSGGLGVSPDLQGIVERQLRAVGAPNDIERNVIGFGMAAPTILTHGTDEQRAAAAATPVHLRGDLVPALQRTGGRIRRGRSGHPGRPRR